MIFLFATAAEAQRFRDAHPTATTKICGVGSAECAATTAEVIAQMQQCGKCETLVLAGIAGSYSLDQVAICEVVEVVNTQIAALPKRFATSYSTKPQTSLRSVTLNSVNQGNECKSNAQIEDMEGAAFIAICQRLAVNAIHIRAISNKVGDPFELWQVDQALEALTEELSQLLNNHTINNSHL